MAQTRGSPWDRRPEPGVRELFFLDRLSTLVLCAVIVAFTGTVLALGRAALLIHIHFATARDAGEELNPVSSFLGAGSGILTSLPGWLAAIFFGYAIVRLRSGPLEPPPGHIPAEKRSVTQLRSGLRAEFRIVRIVLTTLTTIAAIDASRALQYVVAAIKGNTVAHDSVLYTSLEAAGLVAAAIALGIWVWRFRADLDRLGAL